MVGADETTELWWPAHLLGLPMLMDPHPSQQHVGLQHAVYQLQQEVSRHKARLKPTLPKKSEWMGRNQVPKYLGQLLHLWPQR